jgi:hypothetical protein
VRSPPVAGVSFAAIACSPLVATTGLMISALFAAIAVWRFNWEDD